MITRNITDSVLYTGIDDHKTQLFEALWPLPYGVTYNAYVVRGKRIALIDAVEEGSFAQYMSNLEECGITTPDYLIVNHMEPDHSGSIPMLVEKFPEMKIVGNRMTISMIKGYYQIMDDARYVEIKDGDTLDLGDGKVLRFHTVPMVHWPETMVTWLECEGVLFSGDAFGTFGTTDSQPLDDNIADLTPYLSEMRRYYACIVAKYAEQVQRALTKLQGYEVKYICSTHGPVWHKHVAEIVGIYDSLSRYEARKGAVVVYGSMYGHTADMARVIADRLASHGVEVRMHDASTTDNSFMLADIWSYNTLIVGAPTYNGAIFPPVASLLTAIEARGLKKRYAAAFGSHTWASAACRKINDTLSALGLDMPAPPIDMKMSMTPEVEAELQHMTDTLATAINTPAES